MNRPVDWLIYSFLCSAWHEEGVFCGVEFPLSNAKSQRQNASRTLDAQHVAPASQSLQHGGVFESDKLSTVPSVYVDQVRWGSIWCVGHACASTARFRGKTNDPSRVSDLWDASRSSVCARPSICVQVTEPCYNPTLQILGLVLGGQKLPLHHSANTQSNKIFLLCSCGPTRSSSAVLLHGLLNMETEQM